MPVEIAALGQIHGRDAIVSEPLRQELHAWGMATIFDAHRRYKIKLENRNDRAEQIAAPLRVIADMTGNQKFIGAVETALARLTTSHNETASAEDLVLHAVEMAIQRGARDMISLAQVRLELALIPEARTLEPTGQLPQALALLQDSRALGLILRNLGIRQPGDGPRVRLSGQLMRCYELAPEFVTSVLQKADKEKLSVEPPYTAKDDKRLGVAFCATRSCQSCPYSSICEATLPGVRDEKWAARRSG